MSAEQSQVVDPQDFNPPNEYQFSGNSVTVENKQRLVSAYRERGTISHAAETVGVSRKCVHHYLNTDPEFAEAMADAREDSGDILESSVYERAFKSDLLAMFYLKAYRPKFRDKVQVDLSSIQEQIDQMVGKLDTVNRQQLPQAVTQFIDTGYSVEQGEYQPISHPSDNQQKEECGTCNIPNSE